MHEFIVFARRMITDRTMLAFAIVCAIISAGIGGVGVTAIAPAIKLIGGYDEGIDSLKVLGERFNEADKELLGVPIDIPAWIIDLVPPDRLGGVIFIVIFVAILTVIGASFNFLHQYLSITVATRTVAHTRRQLFDTAINMPLVEVTRRGASEFIARIIRDTAALQRGLISLMSKSVMHSTQAIVFFAVAIVVGRRMTLAALILLPLLAIFLRKIGKRIRRASRGALKRQEELLRVATESVQGIRSLKANTGERAALERFEALNQQVVREDLRARLARALSSPIIEVIAVLATGGLVVLAAREIIGDTLSIDRFVLAMGALFIAGSKFKLMAGLINDMQAASAPARRVLDVLDTEPERRAGAKTLRVPPHRKSIRFEDVVVTYPGADEAALRGVTLEVPHGTRVAVVGPNGCGKTTLLSLIPRLVRPESGRVLVDDLDVEDADLTSLRQQVAVVTQESFLFRGTVTDNVRYGMDNITEAQVEQACRRAHAHEFVKSLPDGYDTEIAELGASLSGGQRQRLAIARAILRSPSVLILDEATSAIDPESEAKITQAINEFARGRTVLLIAHRLATVLDADLIVVMERGKIVDQGTHEELLGRCALYRRLSHTELVAAAG